MGENEDGEAEQWIRQIALGDRGGLSHLYDNYSRRLYSLAVKMLNHPEVAREVLQDTFVSIWKSAADYDAAKSGVFSWMVMILRRKSIDRMRYESSRIPGPLAPSRVEIERGVEPLSPSTYASQKEQSTAVKQSLDHLPADQREVLDLAFFAGMTHEEVASRLNLPLGTIKSRIRLGLNKLRTQLGNFERLKITKNRKLKRFAMSSGKWPPKRSRLLPGKSVVSRVWRFWSKKSPMVLGTWPHISPRWNRQRVCAMKS